MTWRFARLTAWAFCEMILYDLTFRIFGFNYVRSRLTKQNTARPRAGPELAASICKAVNLAACFNYRPVMCLQKSAVTFRLLRTCGTDAHLVIGHRSSPFISHAWIEVDGRVVNDSAAYKDQLKVLWRI